MQSVLPRSAARPVTRVPVIWALLLAVLTATALAMVPTRAEAYPEAQCEVSVSAQAIKEGQKLTVKGSAGQSLTWTTTFNGETRTGTGKTFSARYTGPAVSQPTTYQLRLNAEGSASASCHRTFDITVSPKGAPRDGDGDTSGPTTDNDGLLPNTGGPQLALLGLALLLLLAGATSIRRARRVSDEV